MFRVKTVLIIIAALFPLLNFAQKIFYSEPDRNDQKTLNYDVVGKMNDHYLVYKNYKTKNYVSIYDGEMKLVDNIDLDFVPDGQWPTVPLLPMGRAARHGSDSEAMCRSPRLRSGNLPTHDNDSRTV